MAANLTEQQLANFKAVFAQFDKDGNGKITSKELEAVMNAMGQKPTQAQVQALIKDIDDNMNGTVEFDEFAKMMAKLQSTDDLRAAFRQFDHDGNGKITKDELRSTMAKMGHKMSDEELDGMIKAADRDGDGKVNYEEFIKMMAS